jgi:hypothetical protein
MMIFINGDIIFTFARTEKSQGNTEEEFTYWGEYNAIEEVSLAVAIQGLQCGQMNGKLARIVFLITSNLSKNDAAKFDGMIHCMRPNKYCGEIPKVTHSNDEIIQGNLYHERLRVKSFWKLLKKLQHLKGL